ncbi:NAD-dependent epimerase/dehydratase family protein [Paenibacillus sp. Marseille-Q4541]|uniref:NAD-dependent epimerase/dehydratase family protein n=1 Tax=Paenibacillus sp. Marseille-Q4541 TaxID=2831522 RepID=UPI001BAA322C|nr:NAD-dependent epimerase/dehydratase family protein [Paenibacillus sp. Marseille-Q4541]
MSDKVLVFGGTRFFGKSLVEFLLDQSDVEITVASRGNNPFPFGPEVKHLILDREDDNALALAAKLENWDVVYDNICYSAEDAQKAVQHFEGVKRYIFTSSLSVYEAGEQGEGGFKEKDFDPYTYPVEYKGKDQVSYQEGKRQAEAVFMQKASFPVVCVRFPIVLGPHDYTKRLHFHVEHVQQELPIGIPNVKADLGFIHSSEAARFLGWLKDSDITGPVNAASNGTVQLERLIHLIEQATGKKARIQSDTEKEHASPFGISAPWYMNTKLAQKAGFEFDSLEEWLPRLIQEISM